jgi:hypothetical protein
MVGIANPSLQWSDENPEQFKSSALRLRNKPISFA